MSVKAKEINMFTCKNFVMLTIIDSNVLDLGVSLWLIPRLFCHRHLASNPLCRAEPGQIPRFLVLPSEISKKPFIIKNIPETSQCPPLSFA